MARVARTADWIKSEFDMQQSPQDFARFGGEQYRSAGTVLVVR